MKPTMPWRRIRPGAGWRRFYRPGIFVSVLLAGCSSWHQPVPIPLELTQAGVQARLRIPAEANVNLAGTVMGSGQRSHPSQALANNASSLSQGRSRWPTRSRSPSNTAPGCGRPAPPSNEPAVKSRWRLPRSCQRLTSCFNPAPP